jgi:transposase InsO family protein
MTDWIKHYTCRVPHLPPSEASEPARIRKAATDPCARWTHGNGSNRILLANSRNLVVSMRYTCRLRSTDEDGALYSNNYRHLCPRLHEATHPTHMEATHGIPLVHGTDRGSTFTAAFTKSLYKGLGIEPRFSTAYHPQTQGQVENNNKWMETYLRMFCSHRQDDWVDLLLMAEFCVQQPPPPLN